MMSRKIGIRFVQGHVTAGKGDSISRSCMPGPVDGRSGGRICHAWVGVSADVNEELLAVVETDSCGVRYRPYWVYSAGQPDSKITEERLHDRQPGEWAGDPRGSEIPEQSYPAVAAVPRLVARAHDGGSTAEKEELIALLFEQLMSTPFEELFDWKEIDFEFPPKAGIFNTIQCTRCGEGVIDIKATETARGPVCPGCLAENGGR